MNPFLKIGLVTLLVAALTAVVTPVQVAATTITIVNLDGPGEGFNDPAAAAPVGGNPGTTVGQQRLNVFTFAAHLWESILLSDVGIRIGAKFDPLSCTPTGGVLGSAGPQAIYRDYPSAPLPGTWYVSAEADMHTASDRGPGQPDLTATFNSMVGTANCLPNSSWYYGFDNNEPVGTVNLLVVLLHEFGHGLGFLSTVDNPTGAPTSGFLDAYSRLLFDNTTGLHWDQMTNVQRAASAIDTGNLVWDGPTANATAQTYLCPRTITTITTPPALAGIYQSPLAGWNADCSATASGQITLVNDGLGTTSDACSAIAQNLNGQIALIDRGNCTFIAKVLNAQNAGAAGVIVVNDQAGAPFAMGGDGTGLTIPAVMISLSDGTAIKAQLSAGVSATIGPDITRLSGADSNGRVTMYNPNPLEPGSSIGHWSTEASPNLLMEPAINRDLPISTDLTRNVMHDIGWTIATVATSQLPALAAERLTSGVLVSWQTNPTLQEHAIYIHRQQATTARVQISAGTLPWGATSFLDATAPAGPVNYWLELVSPTAEHFWQGPLTVTGTSAPTSFSFAPGFPNPFVTETQLQYSLPTAGMVRVTVHDLRGRLMRNLVDERESRGTHAAFWDGRNDQGGRVAAGVYYARISYAGSVRTQKILVLR